MEKIFTAKDGAQIYYEDTGSGQPLFLIHGWTCSSRFWRNNAPELSKDFRVITMDLRGHGNSSKILTGHTIPQYAQDIRALIEHLGLDKVILSGWSLAGPVVLSYWQQFSADSRLKGMGLIDFNPCPFSQEDWNCHALKETTFDGMNRLHTLHATDIKGFANDFAGKFSDTKAADGEHQWMVAELLKTPAWIAAAIYSDYLLRDYTTVLPTITIPVIVVAANSEIYKNGIQQGKYIADQIPNSKFASFNTGGHIMFYEQPEKFNRILKDFIHQIN
ncbi:MAG: alpha/beta hydrolase [Negativicutes bacterium]|nr:alpha/beta hydrolase [Negativicutes bacterium]